MRARAPGDTAPAAPRWARRAGAGTILTATIAALAGGSALAAGSAPTHAQAVAYAHKVNLRPSDLKGFHEGKSKQHESPAEKKISGDFARCAGATGLKKDKVAEIESPDFERGNAAAQSDVTVERSAADATKGLKLAQRSHTTACMRTALHKLLHQPMPGGVTFTASKLEQSHPTVPGSGGAFEFDLQLIGEVHHKKVPVYLSLIGFVHGPAEIGLTLTSALEPIPASAADALLSLLDKRALSAKI